MNYVYILTNHNNTVLYVGVTNNLTRRMLEHINHLNPNSFSARYKLYKLVFIEEYERIDDAIICEKHIKNMSRAEKMKLVTEQNPNWKNLFDGYSE